MSRKNLCTLLILWFLIHPLLAEGKEPFALTLSEALKLAGEQNPDLLAGRQELEIVRGRLVKAQYPIPFNPEINSGGARRSFGSGPGGSNDFEITLSQELEVAGQRTKRIEEATHNLAKVTQQVKDTERLTLAQVKDAFFRNLYLKKRLELFQDVETLNRRLRDIAALRFQAGDVPKMDVNVAEVRLGQSRKDTIVAGRDSQNALRELERLLGLEPEGRIGPTGTLTVKPQVFQEDRLLHVAMENRPDLQAVTIEQKRVEAEIALTRRLIVPNPTLQAFYREEEGGDTIIGSALTFPLPFFDRKQAELTQLAGRKSQARYEQQSVELRIQQEVRDAFRSYEAAREEVAVFETEVLDRAAENFQLMETAYREGKINLLQVVVVQNDLVNAQFSYVDSLWNYWLAHTALERAVGQDL
ncbi:MAG TPA: TolC family protein [Candidatus Binatia bacterium]|nr:TolC family protein [Candidatus Binatia bacterium]